MSSRPTSSSLALIALTTLAVLSALAIGAAAEEHHDDWSVDSPETRYDETIYVSGVLSIELEGALRLDGCTLMFTGGSPADTRILVKNGGLSLKDTKVTMANGGLMVVEDRLDLQGKVMLEHIDVLVKGLGSLEARATEILLRGSYSTPSINDPLTLHVAGTAAFFDAKVSLEHAFVSSDGDVSFVRSSLEASADFRMPYDDHAERLRFEDGAAILIESTFSQLWLGIHSRADLTVRQTEFNSSDLHLFVPWWHDGMRASLDGCDLLSSDLLLSVERTGSHTQELDVEIANITMSGGNLVLDLDEAISGSVVVRDLDIEGFSGYGAVVEARGIDGELVLEDLDIEGPYGMQFIGDYSGALLRDSVVRALKTGLDLTGTVALVPTRFEDLTISGEVGMAARNTFVTVVGSDLLRTEVPVRALQGSSFVLVDCELEEALIQMHVDPGGRNATIYIDRHLHFDPIEWSIGDTIDEGELTLYTYYENSTVRMLLPVGADDPRFRILEWWMNDRGQEVRNVAELVRAWLIMDEHTFATAEEGIDPWQDGPVGLYFIDDVAPWAKVDPRVTTELSEPSLHLWGTCGDVGTGLSGLEWSLYSPTGELVDNGHVDHLLNGHWSTTIDVTANRQYVVLTTMDRSGNSEDIPWKAVDVSVPTPILTVLSPSNGLVTNLPQVQVTGTVDWYGDHVEVHVVGRPTVVNIPVEQGQFSGSVALPHEGLNQVVVRSVDPFDGSHEKWLSITRDTIAPGLWFDTLDEDRLNHVNIPSLVVVGGTDDPKATIIVNGYQVGLLDNGVFATTVALNEGQQTLRVEATDRAGNTERVEVRILLDTVDPRLTLVSPATNPFWSNRSLVTVVVATDEPLSSISMDGEALDLISDRATVTIELATTRTELELRAVDLAGNVAELIVVLGLDTEAPRMHIVHPSEGAIVNTTAIQLIVVADEPGCTLSSPSENVTIDVIERNPGRLVGTVYLPRGEGVRTIELVLTDRAGNTDFETLALDVDTIRPTISLPGISEDMRVTTEPLLVRGYTEPDAKVVWVNGQMADLSPDGQFEITIRLEEGWQNIMVEIIDRAGNYASKSTPVKVLAAPDFEVPVTALAAGTITFTMAALVVSTEVGRYGILVLFLPLYTKLQKGKILDQRTRGLIQGYITANPGANYTIIRDNLDLADGTLTYHLQVLEREGYIYSIREGLFRCFYPHGLPPPRRGKLHLSDTQADIVRIVKRIPGITVGEIATAMNRRPNVISYHLKLLREGGLLRVEEDGRHVRVYPIETAVAMI